jgi:branched-chain amino acid aminotransferase
MKEPVAYLNGEWVPAREAKVSVHDSGFIQGTTVAERLRTFRGKLFHPDHHLGRLAKSLAIIGVDLPLAMTDLSQIAQELAQRNHALLDPGDDLGMVLFVTPGIEGKPTVCLHTEPLAFHTWADKYATGDSLAETSVQQIPSECWPPELKCRSRMHYFLADREARVNVPGSRAIMLDANGWVTEASTANLLIYTSKEGLISPPPDMILPGVTVAAIAELAPQCNLALGHRPIRVSDLLDADEVLLCSTSPVVWAVTRFNGKPLKQATPGPVVTALQKAWSGMVGIDLVAQATRFARR